MARTHCAREHSRFAHCGGECSRTSGCWRTRRPSRTSSCAKALRANLSPPRTNAPTRASLPVLERSGVRNVARSRRPRHRPMNRSGVCASLWWLSSRRADSEPFHVTIGIAYACTHPRTHSRTRAHADASSCERCSARALRLHACAPSLPAARLCVQGRWRAWLRGSIRTRTPSRTWVRRCARRTGHGPRTRSACRSRSG